MAYTLEDEFGDIIGKARRGNGLSVGEVAAGAGITEAQLSQMEDYTLKPTEDQIHKIAACLNLNGDTIGRHRDGTLGARTGPIGIRRRFGGRHHHSGCRWMARPCVPLSVQSDQRGCYHRHSCAPRRCAAKGGRDRRQADRDPADACTRRSCERFDGDRTGNRLPDIHPRTGTTTAQHPTISPPQPWGCGGGR